MESSYLELWAGEHGCDMAKIQTLLAAESSFQCIDTVTRMGTWNQAGELFGITGQRQGVAAHMYYMS